MGFSLIFEVLERFWSSKNPKKLLKIGSEKLSEVKNEVKTGQGRPRQRKMEQHEGFWSQNGEGTRAK